MDGVGLGLKITRKLLDVNGARISVRSIKAVGSTFSGYVPTVALPNLASSKFGRCQARVAAIFLGPLMYSNMVVSCILIINERSLGFGVRGGYIFM